MNSRKCFFSFIILSSLTYGCATATSYTKPGVDFSEYKRCAVTQLDSASNPSVGQEVADTIAIEFIKKGYNVIERSQLETLIEERKLRQVGLLRESTKEALLFSGIDSIVVGAVGTYYCVPSSLPIFFMGAILGVLPTNDCHVSISLKMLDVRTGNILWAANGSHSKNDANMTANKVLQGLLRRFSREIPTP